MRKLHGHIAAMTIVTRLRRLAKQIYLDASRVSETASCGQWREQSLVRRQPGTYSARPMVGTPAPHFHRLSDPAILAFIQDDSQYFSSLRHTSQEAAAMTSM